MTKNDRNSELIRLWLRRPEDEKTETGVLIFYRWLQQNRQELPLSRYGDPYQQLKTILRPYIKGSLLQHGDVMFLVKT